MTKAFPLKNSILFSLPWILSHLYALSVWDGFFTADLIGKIDACLCRLLLSPTAIITSTNIHLFYDVYLTWNINCLGFCLLLFIISCFLLTFSLSLLYFTTVIVCQFLCFLMAFVCQEYIKGLHTYLLTYLLSLFCWRKAMMSSTASVCYAACASNCLECPVNGPGKCDTSKCGPQTWFDSTTKTCKSNRTQLDIFHLIGFSSRECAW